MASEAVSFTLNTGRSIPAIGLGMGGQDLALLQETVLHAIKVGYRHFDTAAMYENEGALGEALAEAFRRGLVKREEVFVTSKLWAADSDPEDVLPALQKSLSLLRLDYIDLYLIHWPLKFKKGAGFPVKEDDFLPVNTNATWQALEKCAEGGLIRDVGVSNFTVEKLKQLLDTAKIVPAVNQVERHVLWQQKKLKPFCDANGILLSGWSPLGSPGSFWGTPDVLNNPVIQSIAKKYDKSVGQVALRWGVQSGACVIPRSSKLNRINENFDIFNWRLHEDDMRDIDRLEQHRKVLGEFFVSPLGPYKNVSELWDGDL